MSSYFPVKTMWRSFFCSFVAVFVLQVSNLHYIYMNYKLI